MSVTPLYNLDLQPAISVSGGFKESNAPAAIKLSIARRLSAPGDTLATKSNGEVNLPDLRASISDDTQVSPIPLIAVRPYRTPSSCGVNPKSLSFISGGRSF